MATATRRSQQKEVERLAGAVAKKLAPVVEQRKPLSRADGKQLANDAEAALRRRRESSTWYLNRHQLLPWKVASGVFGVAVISWLIGWLMGDVFWSLMVVAVALMVAWWVAWMVGNRHRAGRDAAYRAAGATSIWLPVAMVVGPSWSVEFAELVLAWVVLTVLASSRWWKQHRPAYPSSAEVAVPDREIGTISGMWAEYLGGQGCVLVGSWLDHRDDSKPNRESYTVNLRPGKQTITGTIGQLELISGGLHTPIKKLVLEPHPDENPNHLKLTVMKVSPIERTLHYSGARIVGDRRNMIEIGPYGDNEGWARWRMWQPGEEPMTGSWLSGAVIAGSGIGKSRLMELLAAGYMASGCAVVWFIDPQGGASSPALQKYADWYVSREGAARMITAIEKIAEAREAEMGVMGWSRFDPSPERPGLVVFIDEFHEISGQFATRLEKLARKIQKLGIAIVALTQGASLESLGKDILRACLTTNLIVMKTGSNQTQHLLPGLTVNPETLPKIAGFGYTIGVDGESRTAPFRAEYLKKPATWFERYDMPVLDALSATSPGDLYLRRTEKAEEEHETKRAWVEQLRAGQQPQLPTAEDAESDDEPSEEEAQASGGFVLPVFPSDEAPRPQDKPSWERVLSAVARGITRPKEIEKEVGLSARQVQNILNKLVDEQHLERPTTGVYAIAGSASPPER